MSKNKLAVGALIGAAVGAVAALLTAPKSGKETREALKRRAGKLKTEAEKKAEELKSKAENVKKEVEGQAVDLRERTENAIKGAKEGFDKKPLGPR